MQNGTAWNRTNHNKGMKQDETEPDWDGPVLTGQNRTEERTGQDICMGGKINFKYPL